jgi:hypothetical protein
MEGNIAPGERSKLGELLANSWRLLGGDAGVIYARCS